MRLQITYNRRLMDCNVMIFMETWLHSGIPNNAIKLVGHHTLRADRTADDSSKKRGGGLCIYINKAWCTNSVIVWKDFSANLENLMVKCRPFYLQREFTSFIDSCLYPSGC